MGHGRVRTVFITGLALAACGLVTCNRKVVSAFPENFVGVGVELKVDDDVPTVVRLISGGPADQAGVEPNDRLLAIDGVSTRGVSLSDVVLRLRGESGSTVLLKLERRGTEVLTTVVRTGMRKNGEAYVPQARNN